MKKIIVYRIVSNYDIRICDNIFQIDRFFIVRTGVDFLLHGSSFRAEAVRPWPVSVHEYSVIVSIILQLWGQVFYTHHNTELFCVFCCRVCLAFSYSKKVFRL